MARIRKIEIEYRVPRAETERVADALAERLGIDPERVPCDFIESTVVIVKTARAHEPRAVYRLDEQAPLP